MLAVLTLASTSACSDSGGALPPSPAPTVQSVAVDPARVVGGNVAVQGTVTLSAVPTTGVTVLLSSNSTFVFVPSALTISAGSMSGTFPIATTPVQLPEVATISAAANSTTRSALLTLTSGLTARLAVRSLSPALAWDPTGLVLTPVPGQGAGASDSCPLVVGGGNPTLDCQFDGAASTSEGLPIAKYIWTYSFGNQIRTEESTSPVFRPTASGCGVFSNQAGPDGPFIEMTVRLRVANAGGGGSEETSSRLVRLYPAGLCGYRF